MLDAVRARLHYIGCFVERMLRSSCTEQEVGCDVLTFVYILQVCAKAGRSLTYEGDRMFQGSQDRRAVRNAVNTLKGTRLDDIVREMRTDGEMKYDGIRLVLTKGVWSVDLANGSHRLSGWMLDLREYCIRTMWTPGPDSQGSRDEEANVATMKLKKRTEELIARVLNERAGYWRKRAR